MNFNVEELDLSDLEEFFPHIAPKNKYRVVEFDDIEGSYRIIKDFSSLKKAKITARKITKRLILIEACVYDDGGTCLYYGRDPRIISHL